MMKKPKKTDLKKVVKKAERESVKNHLSAFKEHTTKPIIKPKNKRKKPKEKIDDGKKKERRKAGVKPKQGTKDKTLGGKSKQGGGKTVIQKPPVKGERVSILDRILPPWF